MPSFESHFYSTLTRPGEDTFVDIEEYVKPLFNDEAFDYSDSGLVSSPGEWLSHLPSSALSPEPSFFTGWDNCFTGYESEPWNRIYDAEYSQDAYVGYQANVPSMHFSPNHDTPFTEHTNEHSFSPVHARSSVGPQETSDSDVDAEGESDSDFEAESTSDSGYLDDDSSDYYEETKSFATRSRSHHSSSSNTRVQPSSRPSHTERLVPRPSRLSGSSSSPVPTPTAPRLKQASTPYADLSSSALKSLKCPVCSLMFRPKRQSDLKRHYKAHFAHTFTFVCNGVCIDRAEEYGVKDFSNAIVFNGEKRVGMYCLKEFTRRDALVRHLKQVENTCVCDIIPAGDYPAAALKSEN